MTPFDLDLWPNNIEYSVIFSKQQEVTEFW